MDRLPWLTMEPRVLIKASTLVNAKLLRADRDPELLIMPSLVRELLPLDSMEPLLLIPDFPAVI